MDLRSRSTARAWHALTFVVGVAALVLQLVLVIKGSQHLGEDAGPRPPLGTRLANFASFLTIWCNVLGTASVAPLVLDPDHDGRVWRTVRLAGTVILLAGGTVHFFLLRPLLTHLQGGDLIADRLLHMVVPLLVGIGWLVFGPRGRVDRRAVVGMLAILLAWFAYTLVRGALVDWYPYPFVDVTEHGYAYVLVSGLLIGLAMVGLALLFKALDPRLPGRPAPEASLPRAD